MNFLIAPLFGALHITTACGVDIAPPLLKVPPPPPFPSCGQCHGFRVCRRVLMVSAVGAASAASAASATGLFVGATLLLTLRLHTRIHGPQEDLYAKVFWGGGSPASRRITRLARTLMAA